jgi:hypothetical protein
VEAHNRLATALVKAETSHSAGIEELTGFAMIVNHLIVISGHYLPPAA